MARKLKIMENETQTLQDLEYGQKQSKTWKMRNAHSRTWNMARKVINVENKKHTLQDLEYFEKTDKRQK